MSHLFKGQPNCLGRKRWDGPWPAVSWKNGQRSEPTHTVTKCLVWHLWVENTHTLLLLCLIWMDFTASKTPAWKMCVKKPKCQRGGSWRETGGLGEKGNSLMEKRQYKVCVGGLPSLWEKYHSHIHSGLQDSPWHKHVGQTVTISVQSRPCGP